MKGGRLGFYVWGELDWCGVWRLIRELGEMATLFVGHVMLAGCVKKRPEFSGEIIEMWVCEDR